MRPGMMGYRYGRDAHTMARNERYTSGEALSTPICGAHDRLIMMVRMEQNSVVVMLDEEISRLRQVRTILQSLVAVEAQVAPLLVAAAEPAEEEETSEEPAVVRHVSRRGIKTGRRGPRAKQAAAPRALDAAVPKAPVVVSRSAAAAQKVVATPPPAPAPDGTLEAWVRSLKQARPAA